MANKSQVKSVTRRIVKYPNLRRAAIEMGYNFTYLYRVLEGRDPHFKGRKGLKDDFWRVSARITKERNDKRLVKAV